MCDARHVEWVDTVTGAKRLVEIDGANYDEAASIAQALSYWSGATDVVLISSVMGRVPVQHGQFVYAQSHVTAS